MCFIAHRRLSDAEAKHCGTFLWAHTYSLGQKEARKWRDEGEEMLKKSHGGCWEIVQKIKNKSFCSWRWWWWWWWRCSWQHSEQTWDASANILQPVGCEQSAELSGLRVASLSAVDVKQSSRLGLTWPFYGARLLLSFNVLPNCKFSNLPVHPRVLRYGLYVGLLWLLIWGFFRQQWVWRCWWICFALASWMHIGFYWSHILRFEISRALLTLPPGVWFLPLKCHLAQKSGRP